MYGEDSMPTGVNLSHLIPPFILGQDNENLLIIPNADEIRNVVFSMGDYKAPGPDVLPIVFFKTYRSTMGRDVICMVRHFFLSGFLHHGINATNVVLISRFLTPQP